MQHAAQTAHPPEASTRRGQRSRAGCLTCKKRKVRCNERRPRCSNCERLNLDCTWKTVHLTRRDPANNTFQQGENVNTALALQTRLPGSFDGSTPHDLDASLTDMFNLPDFVLDASTRSMLLDENGLESIDINSIMMPGSTPNNDFSPSNLSQDIGCSAVVPVSFDETQLLNDFFEMGVPPILDAVETGPRWTSAKSFLQKLSSTSVSVRLAIIAFAAVQSRNSNMNLTVNQQAIYLRAQSELSSLVLEVERDVAKASDTIRPILATTFLLAYADILNNRMDPAHKALEQAHRSISGLEGPSLGPAERRLIAWIRLLDARVVSAGGEGLFLEKHIGSVSSNTGESPMASNFDGDPDQEVEETLFDILYAPGLEFFQEVEVIMGRITKIDRWHRNRDTVEDETEVMILAAQISKDLKALYASRPPLMDHIVRGTLTEKFLAKSLISALCRSFRAYLANFWACHVHLHRVAYRHLPVSNNVQVALQEIRSILNAISESSEALPVNLLWPLLMWGSEEQNTVDREWILGAIRGLRYSATNARLIADLLQEVQRRQDTQKQRVDIKEVSRDIFGICFPIL